MTEPSRLLAAAADRIRDLAAAATPGHWFPVDMEPHGHPGAWWVDSKHLDDGGMTQGCVADLSNIGAEADAHWVAALSPAVAEPLINWLRPAVHLWGQWERSWEKGHLSWDELVMAVGPQAKAAYDLARVIVPDLAGETP